MTGPVPARVDAPVKDVLLGLVDHAVGQGWSVSRACRVLGLDPRRVHRWIDRRARRDLSDHRPGASVNALLQDEVAAIVAVFDSWARPTGRTGGWPTAAATSAGSGPRRPRSGGC